VGQNRKYSPRAHIVRFAPNSGPKSDIPPCPFGAMNGSQLRAVRVYSGERRLSAIPYFNEVLIDVNLVLSMVRRSN
jgi:hypothetical protein